MAVSVNQMAGAVAAPDGLVTTRAVGLPWYADDKGRFDDASMALDLAYDDVTAWGFAHTRADATTCATYFDSAGVMQTAAANVLRRTHDPATLAPLGYLAEEGSTNGIRNSTMAGAAAGTPGTLPTNWASALAGLSRQIVGTGTESGIAYTDVRFFGTTSSTAFAINPEFNNIIAASVGQSWTGSVYISLVGGSTANISGSFLQTVHYTSGPAYISDSTQAITVSAGALRTSRKTVTGTAPATTAFVQPQLAFTCSSGVAIDITLRIGAPQLEQKAFATSFIPTSAAAVTRAADSLLNTGLATAGWYAQSQGAWIVEYIRSGGTADAALLEVSDNTGNNRFIVSEVASVPRLSGTKSAAGLTAIDAPGGTATLGVLHKVGIAWDASGMAIVRGGGSVGTSASFPAQSGSTHLNIGRVYWGGSIFSGTIRRIRYYKTRLSNARLQALTA